MTTYHQIMNLCDAMRQGLKLYPNSIKAWNPFDAGQRACCPLAHAYVGLGGDPAEYSRVNVRFPVLDDQMVKNEHGPEYEGDPAERTLGLTIEVLSGDYQWTTEQVIEWLETKLKQ